ncbi:MAG: hypothetical protein ABI461_06645 [Polyangiaceae bacterium]
MKYASKIGLSAIFAACSVACTPSVDITRVVSQDQAERFSGGKLAPSAIVHADGSRTPLSSDTTIAHGRAIIPKSHGIFVVKIGPNDVIQVDIDDRITGVRMADGHVVSFVPGTAFSPENADEVRGRLAGGDTSIDLAPTDRVEVSGMLVPDDSIAGVGHVETSRFTFALVFGGIVTALAYAPTAVVGVSSSRKGDRVLLLPVFGPWIDLLGRDKCITPPQIATDTSVPADPCVAETGNRVGLITSGVAQVLGGILFVAGLPEHAELIEDEPGHSKAANRARPDFSWTIAPLSAPHATGVAAVGTF